MDCELAVVLVQAGNTRYQSQPESIALGIALAYAIGTRDVSCAFIKISNIYAADGIHSIHLRKAVVSLLSCMEAPTPPTTTNPKKSPTRDTFTRNAAS